MQDRPGKARRRRKARIGMQGIAVPGQAVDQGLVRPGGDVDGGVRCPFGDRMGLGRAFGRAAEAPVSPGEDGGGEGGDGRAVPLVLQHGLGDYHRALGPLVIDPHHPAVGQDDRLGRHRPVQFHRLLAMDHHQVVEAHLAGRTGPPGHYRRQGREGLQVVLVDKAQLVRIQGIGPHADAQGVEHRLPIRPRKALADGLQIKDLGIGDRHGWAPVPPGWVRSGTMGPILRPVQGCVA